MKDKYGQLVARLDAFNKRERILLLAGSIVCIYMIWDAVLLQPLEQEKKGYTGEITSLSQQISKLETEVSSIIAKGKIDPDKDNKAALEKLNKDFVSIDLKLKGATLGLVTPKQMPRMLEDVLVKSRNIKLVRMESIPAVSLVKQIGAESAEPITESVSAGVFRHGLLMEIEGSYLDTLSFLKHLEQLKWKLYWDSIEFKTEKYPKANVIIRVYTLSLNKGWIGV